MYDFTAESAIFLVFFASKDDKILRGFFQNYSWNDHETQLDFPNRNHDSQNWDTKTLRDVRNNDLWSLHHPDRWSLQGEQPVFCQAGGLACPIGHFCHLGKTISFTVYLSLSTQYLLSNALCDSELIMWTIYDIRLVQKKKSYERVWALKNKNKN